jgi:hypothetical protein
MCRKECYLTPYKRGKQIPWTVGIQETLFAYRFLLVCEPVPGSPYQAAELSLSITIKGFQLHVLLYKEKIVTRPM